MPKDTINDKDTIEAVLTLMGHSQNTIREVLDSRTITPKSSSVYSDGKLVGQIIRQGQPSMESTPRNSEGKICEICIEKKNSTVDLQQQNNVIICESAHTTDNDIVIIQQQSGVEANDSNLSSPVMNTKKCWQCFL